MNPIQAKVRSLRPRSAKQLGYWFPVYSSVPTIRIRKAWFSWTAAAVMMLAFLVVAQCAIDIPGVDIPDVKDIPGVSSWLQDIGFHQVQLDLLGLQ